MVKSNKLPVINTILLVGVITLLIIHFYNFKQETLVYVDNIKLFNEFNMTRDIKAIEERKINSQARVLDSLYVQFNTLSNDDKNASSTKQLQQQIALKSKQLQELKDTYAHNLNINVWKRLNNYIEIYAQSKGYRVILGTSGNGNVMYAKEGINITNEILEFSNEKYEGN